MAEKANEKAIEAKAQKRQKAPIVQQNQEKADLPAPVNEREVSEVDKALGKVESQTRRNPVDELFLNMVENTSFRSPMVADSFKPPYNSDDLWQKRGDYSIYETMVDDDQVSVCLQLKKDLVIGDGAHIVPGEDGQEEMVECIEAALFENYEGDFISDLEEILTAYEFGFSLTEKVFKHGDDFKLGLKKLKTRHPNSWKLHQDNKGNIEKFEQVTFEEGTLDVNPKSLIHYVNNPRFQNPYGKSDLRSAYYAWFTKTQVIRFMAIFLEKAASPVPVARYDKNAPPAAVTNIFNALKSFQTKTALTIPKEIEVEFLEAKNTGDAYVKAIHLFNMFIGRALFIPDLLGFTGSETGGGSLALGQKQMDLFFLHILRRKNALENKINNEIIKPIVQYNYGFVKKYPKFKFKPLDDMKAVELAKIWLEAAKGKTYTPNPEEINHFRKLVKFPDGLVIMAAPQPNPLDPNAPPGMEGEMHEENEMDEDGNPLGESMDEKSGANNDLGPDAEEQEKDGDKKSLPLKKGVKGAGAAEAEEDDEEKKPVKKEFGKVYDLPSGSYHKKVNFKAIQTKLDDYDQSVMNESKKIVKKIFADLFDQIEKKKIVLAQNTERIDDLKLKYKKELQLCLKNSFRELYTDAQSQANSEILKSEFKKPLTNDKFLEVIEDETFKFIGDYEYGILKKARTELIAAIKDGKPLSSVISVLDRDLNKLSAVQLERFARTKHTEVMNNARSAFFEETGVVAAYQYSAVLDSQTSDICAGLHGKIFNAGDEPTPPLHFNCRSMLIPITKYEEFKPSESVKGQPIDDFIDDNKGEGFATN